MSACKVLHYMSSNSILMIYLSKLNILKCHQVALSKDLCRLIVMCSGDLVEVVDDLGEIHMAGHNEHGLHCLALNTAIFWNR